MQSQPSLPPKPVAEVWQPELTRLPEYTWRRFVNRRILWVMAKLLVRSRVRLTTRGVENFPRSGPGLIVLNHLGDADIIVILSQLHAFNVDPLGASNLHDDYPWIGFFGDLYGTIWLHRGQPDRRAITCALEALQRSRFVAIAPEGRESVVRGLEEGLNGAAFLALKADVPVIPIAVTGTEDPRIYNFKNWSRPPVTMTVGQPFRLEKGGDRHANLANGTAHIMRELARLLPPGYRGVYRDVA